jgi:hypothetical protein
MGTRGIWGFRQDSKDKLTYNHYDSYPTGLGNQIVEFIKNHSIEELAVIAKRIKLVKADSKPTAEQIKNYLAQGTYDGQVSDKTPDDWYCLLRNTMFNPEMFANDKIVHMIDNHKFIEDSLFCEWGYIINLDGRCLEIYTGFQHEPNSKGNRYQVGKPEKGRTYEYYACELFTTIPLKDIRFFPNDAMDSLETIINAEDERKEKGEPNSRLDRLNKLSWAFYGKPLALYP